ncbi:hypothetical protein IQ243_28385 [Nostocales cyanobacterium LEGE 11386]|nr:hypothetical protein [Nostocales cyanobacterium LEGE 11386]
MSRIANSIKTVSSFRVILDAAIAFTQSGEPETSNTVRLRLKTYLTVVGHY